MPIKVVQFDFVQGKFELMLRLKSYASDLDEFAQVTADKGPWARANKVQLGDSHKEGAVLNLPIEGTSRKGLRLGEH